MKRLMLHRAQSAVHGQGGLGEERLEASGADETTKPGDTDMMLQQEATNNSTGVMIA